NLNIGNVREGLDRQIPKRRDTDPDKEDQHQEDEQGLIDGKKMIFRMGPLTMLLSDRRPPG
ncbi:MAG: hypothetical protein ACK55L_05075, partial [bacterium]